MTDTLPQDILVLNIVVAVAVAVLQVCGHACYQVGAGPSSF